MQDSSISSALPMEILQSCTKSSISTLSISFENELKRIYNASKTQHICFIDISNSWNMILTCFHFVWVYYPRFNNFFHIISRSQARLLYRLTLLSNDSYFWLPESILANDWFVLPSVSYKLYCHRLLLGIGSNGMYPTPRISHNMMMVR